MNPKGESGCVVIVDDEDMVITSIKAFLQLETEFDIRGFTDPVQAAEYAATHTVDVIVSDKALAPEFQQLVRGKGIELLLA